MTRNYIIGAIIAGLVILGGWFYIQSQQAPKQNTEDEVISEQTPQATPSATSSAKDILEGNIVAVSSNGFSPKELKIKAGEKVVWVNNDSEAHQINSDSHPSHTLYPPLNTVGYLKKGEKKALEFATKGNFKYHDHLKPSSRGTVVVE